MHEFERDEGEVIEILETLQGNQTVVPNVVFVMDNHLNIYSGRLFK